MEVDSSMTLQREKQDDCVVSPWSRLPEELVEAILALLPIPSLIRAGAVCKGWRSLLNSAGFKLKCRQTAAHRPWLMTLERGHGCRAYSPADDAWYNLSSEDLLQFGTTSVHVVASASGLLCLERNRYHPSMGSDLSLVVLDPMSEDARELPLLEGVAFARTVALHVVEHSCPVAYKVVVFANPVRDDGECALFTSIFDSDVGSWRESSAEISFPPSVVLDRAVAGSTVYCRVLKTLENMYTCIRDYRVVAYDICADSWTEVATNGVWSLERCLLVACQGEVMLVSYGESKMERRDRRRRGLPTGNIKLFLFDNLTMEWRELEQLAHMPADKSRKDIARFRSAGGSKGEIYLRTVWGVIMRYDHSSRIWTTIVPSGLDDFTSQDFFCYEPRWGLCLNTWQPDSGPGAEDEEFEAGGAGGAGGLGAGAREGARAREGAPYSSRSSRRGPLRWEWSRRRSSLLRTGGARGEDH